MAMASVEIREWLRLLASSPSHQNPFQYVNHDATSVHEAMIGALDNLNGTSIGTHCSLHPPDSILCNLLVLVSIQDSNSVGRRRMRNPKNGSRDSEFAKDHCEFPWQIQH